MGYRTDLAIENVEIHKNSLPKGIEQYTDSYDNLTVSTVKITDENGARALEKPMGTYITISPTSLTGASQSFHSDVEIIAQKLKTLFPQNMKSALVVGLGNSQITPDALGPTAVDYIFVTRHIPETIAKQAGFSELFPVSAVAPGVLGQTGIESSQIVKSICENTKPDLVIAIDALASRSVDRLGSTIQIANNGISPGSGVLNKRKELSRATLGVDVISVGVPMVVDLQTIAQDIAQISVSPQGGNENMMVTPREIDLIIEHSAKTLAYAINKALHPSLSVEDIAALVN